MPKELDYACIDALIVSSPKFMPTISFNEKFSNLKSLSFNNVTFNDDRISMHSKLSLLEFISLEKCRLTNDHLSKLFEDCTTLKEIQLKNCKISGATFIKLPSQMKRFEIQHNDVFKLDASDCTQLESL